MSTFAGFSAEANKGRFIQTIFLTERRQLFPENEQNANECVPASVPGHVVIFCQNGY